MEKGDADQIAKFCSGQKVVVTNKRRPEKSRDMGTDMNIPFVQEGFDKYVALTRKDSDTEYLIRTNTSAFWFAKSADGRWMLTKYLDKPID